jgi:hypothetical protein
MAYAFQAVCGTLNLWMKKRERRKEREQQQEYIDKHINVRLVDIWGASSPLNKKTHKGMSSYKDIEWFTPKPLFDEYDN